MCKRFFARRGMDAITPAANTVGMANFRPSHIRAWRKHRGLTLEELGGQIGMSAANLSRLERGLQPYDQAVLESIAAELRCRPADLLVRDPRNAADPDSLLARLEEMPPEDRERAARLIEALTPTERRTA